MVSKYHYPDTSNDAWTGSDRGENAYGKEHGRVTATRAPSTRPATPPLSRASTPSTSGPLTPQLLPTSPVTSKMPRRRVAFATPVSQISRRAEWDELSVMRAFASHARHCDLCADPVKVYYRGKNLCERGTGLAKDIGTYFYCSNGKPYSQIERLKSGERVQIEVPPEYAVVKRLFEALDCGLNLKRISKSSRPKASQVAQPSPTHPSPTKRHTIEPTTAQRRSGHIHLYEVKPAQTASHRDKGPVYQTYGSYNIETRSPYDATQHGKRPSSFQASATPVYDQYDFYRRADTLHTQKRDDTYYTTYYDKKREARHHESRPQTYKRSSTYNKIPETRRSTFVIRPDSQFWK